MPGCNENFCSFFYWQIECKECVCTSKKGREKRKCNDFLYILDEVQKSKKKNEKKINSTRRRSMHNELCKIVNETTCIHVFEAAQKSDCEYWHCIRIFKTRNGFVSMRFFFFGKCIVSKKAFIFSFFRSIHAKSEAKMYIVVGVD